MPKMEGEIFIFIKVCLLFCVSLCYCYFVGKLLPKLTLRLFAVLPIFLVFLSLPLSLSSVYLIGLTSFFITLLATFKLLLFAFGKGPLCADPSLSLSRFLVLASLPVKIQHNPSDKIHHQGQKKQNPPLKLATISIYPLKGLVMGLILWVNTHSDYIHQNIMMVIHSIYIYLFLDMVLATAAWLARFSLGMEMEPQFEKLYLSSSLQEFWGRRWNLMVHRLLHPAVYEPLRDLAAAVIGRKWAPLPAVLGTFCVSALMHELIYYYLGRVRPTWEITCFFLLHGFCVMVQIGIGKAVKRPVQAPKVVAVVLTVGFVVVSGFRLFFPQLFRCRVFARAVEEYGAVVDFVKGNFNLK